jgi:hypothetical protein
MGVNDGEILGPPARLVDHGPDDEKWMLVVTGDGFATDDEMATFEDVVDDFVVHLEENLTGVVNWEKVNVARLDVKSVDSGVDDGWTDTVATYFDARYFDDSGTLEIDWRLVMDAANDHAPEWDAVLVFLNTTERAGEGDGGTRVGIATLYETRNQIALHELGHAGFDLADEYCSGEDAYDAINDGEPVEVNVTATLNPLKWDWAIDSSTAIPTTSNPDTTCTTCDTRTASPVAAGTVGAFEGGYYYKCGIWRPEFNCRMRVSEYDGWCAVCSAQIGNMLTWGSGLDVDPVLCFVAGAVYDDPRHPDVVALRHWRDERLQTGARGRSLMRLLVACYARVGPPLAAATRSRPRAARLLRGALFAPWARALRKREGR